jgi:hypothetical protein
VEEQANGGPFFYESLTAGAEDSPFCLHEKRGWPDGSAVGKNRKAFCFYGTKDRKSNPTDCFRCSGDKKSGDAAG